MILVASGSARIRRRWRRPFEAVDGIYDAADRETLARMMSALTPAVVVVDLALPGLDGARDLAVIQEWSLSTRIIAASASPTDVEGIAALKAGARGYCHRDIETTLLGKAVTVVRAGEIWARRALTTRLLEELATNADERRRHNANGNSQVLERLTGRERQIALLIAAGASNKEVGSKLGIAERTVKSHLTSIFRKVGVTDRLRLALLVNDHAAPPA